ncbi:hypothetical protein [Thiocystis violacea]|uniref:hypothetical protein n=1 Tax=Thiocystis violacea TaxID=13725 RepID=UPI001906565F|nr:hypothetical protein [Thiocystis violacea]MBK1720314.1 hypothetical protein [Thiocystis violacea]
MRSQDVLRVLLDRLGATDGAAILISEQELAQWPAGAIAALRSLGLLVKASPASSVVCPGCEDECSMPVHLVQYPTGRAAFIVCDRRSDISRVPVPTDQLEQWQTSAALFAERLTRLLGLCPPGVPDTLATTRWEIGLFKGRQHSSHLVLTSAEGSLKLTLAGHSVALGDVLFLEDGGFEVDRRALTRLVDQPIAGGGDQESAAQRRERLQRRVDAERAKGTRVFLKTVAEEEGINLSRLKQILAAKPEPVKARSKW